jgi:hypothetical protein
MTGSRGHCPNEGPPGTQQLTITFETGSSGRLNLTRVVWSPQAMFTMTWRGSPWRLTGGDRLIGHLACLRRALAPRYRWWRPGDGMTRDIDLRGRRDWLAWHPGRARGNIRCGELCSAVVARSHEIWPQPEIGLGVRRQGPVKGTSGVWCRCGLFFPHGEIADDVAFASGWSGERVAAVAAGRWRRGDQYSAAAGTKLWVTASPGRELPASWLPSLSGRRAPHVDKPATSPTLSRQRSPRRS